jgi:hypothetical protein
MGKLGADLVSTKRVMESIFSFPVNPVVEVKLESKPRKITIADNGRGMDWEGLRNFFVMHGENLDRKLGQAGRGRFGTGKAAAFGIGDLLRVTTIRDRKRSRVELHRSEMEANESGDPIPVKMIEKDVSCSKSNGTLIEVEGIHLKALDQAAIIRYDRIARPRFRGTRTHLARRSPISASRLKPSWCPTVRQNSDLRPLTNVFHL